MQTKNIVIGVAGDSNPRFVMIDGKQLPCEILQNAFLYASAICMGCHEESLHCNCSGVLYPEENLIVRPKTYMHVELTIKLDTDKLSVVAA